MKWIVVFLFGVGMPFSTWLLNNGGVHAPVPTPTPTPIPTPTPTPTPTPPSLNAPSSATAGDTVTVSWANIPSPTATDRVSLFPASAPDDFTQDLDFLFVSGSKTPTVPIATGSMSFVIPVSAPTDSYEFRLHANNDQDLRLAVDAITITGAATPTPTPTPTPAPTFVQSGAGTVSGSGNITLFAPTTQVPGDLWIAFLYEHPSNGPLVGHGLSGWTQIFNQHGYGVMSAWYFRYNGTLPNRVATRSYAPGDGDFMGHIVVIRGARPSGNPINAVSTRLNGGVPTDLTAEFSAITTTVPNCLHILVDGAAHLYGRTDPAGTTRIDWLHTATGRLWGSMAEYRRVQTSAGSTGTFVSTMVLDGQPSGWPWDSQSFAIRP